MTARRCFQVESFGWDGQGRRRHRKAHVFADSDWEATRAAARSGLVDGTANLFAAPWERKR